MTSSTTPSLQEQLKAAIAKMEERKSKINPESYECIEYDNLDGAIKFGKQVLSMIDKTADAWKAMSLKYVGDPDFDGCIVAGYGLLKKDASSLP